MTRGALRLVGWLVRRAARRAKDFGGTEGDASLSLGCCLARSLSGELVSVRENLLSPCRVARCVSALFLPRLLGLGRFAGRGGRGRRLGLVGRGVVQELHGDGAQDWQVWIPRRRSPLALPRVLGERIVGP